MRRVAQVGWSVVGAGLLLAIVGLLGRPWLIVAGAGVALPAAALALIAERRAAARRISAKGERGHLAVRDCVQSTGVEEPTVRLVADLHLPGRSPSRHHYTGTMPAAAIARLAHEDEVPCLVNRADPSVVWITIAGEEGLPERLVPLRDERRGLPPSR